MKVVLDTNIVVSGLLQPKGNPAQVLSLALAGAVQVCYGHGGAVRDSGPAFGTGMHRPDEQGAAARQSPAVPN